jgi:hypothetical protein
MLLVIPNRFYLISFLIFSLSLQSCEKDNNNSENESTTYKDYEFEEPETIGNTYYIDPINGLPTGDGSSDNPWRTLQEVFDSNLIQYYANVDSYGDNSDLEIKNENAPVKGGDKLVLRTGYHGYLNVSVAIFKDWLTIEGQQGHTPTLSQIRFEGAFEKIYLKNLTVIKESYTGPENYWEVDDLNRNSSSCVILTSSDFWGIGREVKINGLTIKTAEDISGWTADDWVEKSAGGISLRSVENTEIINSSIENISFGITIEYFSDYSIAVNNTIKNYSGDGCRIISNDVFFAYNTITDCYNVDDNHDDAIQSYSRGTDNSPGTGTLKNVVIRGNLIIGTTNYDNPLAGAPQGIGCFDGMFDNWTVENNVIITNHYHGISFYGILNSNIVNNTVIDQIPNDDISPWIMITEHKNGTLSKNCVVANNIAASSISISGTDVSEQNNYVIGKNNYSLIFELFIDPLNYDFHLLNNDFSQLEIIDQGAYFENLVSSDIDKDNTIRNIPPDIGAYELVQ